ncbi:hypothetical protein JCM11491_001915 [Sporobolomyces phaffii]
MGPPTPTLPLAAPRAHAPSTGVLRAKVPTRTYGKRVAPEQDGNGQAGGVKGPPLARHSTDLVPETDFDVVMDDINHKDREQRDRDASRSSSPPASEPRSTSPTSTEEDGPRKAEEEPPHPRNSLLRNLSDESSDEEAQGPGGGAFDFFKRHGNLADRLKAVDDEAASSEDAPASRKIPRDPEPTSSLPPLTDSDPLSHANSSSQPTPSARPSSAAIQILGQADDAGDRAGGAPTKRPSKPRRTVSDSEESDADDGEANTTVRPARASNAPKRSNVIHSSDDEGDVASDSPVRSAPSAPVLSKQEKLAALAAKKKAAMPAVVSPPRKKKDDCSSPIGTSESEGESRSMTKKKQAKKPKVKGLSKKVEEEMNKTSASFARERIAHLEPSVKNRLSVVGTLKRGSSERPTSVAPPAPRTNARPSTDVVTLSSSSDTIVNSSSPPNAAGLSHLSAKALGKQREESPIRSERDATPRARTKVQISRPPAWGKKTEATAETPSSDDENLLSIEAHEHKKAQQKQEKERKEREKVERRNERAARLQRHRDEAPANPDSDNDLEIKDQPLPAPRPPAAPRRTSAATASTPRPGTQLAHVLLDLAGVKHVHHEDATDSQLQCAGKDFGRHLDPAQHYAPSPSAIKSKNRSGSSKARKPIQISQDEHMRALKEKARLQALTTATEKRSEHRRQQQAQEEADLKASDRVDVNGMIEKKKKQREVQQEEDEMLEEAEDSDYKVDSDEGEAQMSDGEGYDAGSGSDAEEPPKKVIELEEGDFDSDGELRMPTSSQNSDRLGTRDAENEHDEEDEEEVLRIRRPNVKPRVGTDDEDEDDESLSKSDVPMLPAPEAKSASTPADSVAPVRMALDVFGGGGDDGGGFSQFFNSQFSQDVAGNNDGEGFARAAEPSPFGNVASTMFVAEPLISTAERAADAALLEARGGIHNAEPGTPREAAIPRQYINKQGFMTQTRPVGLFADSPTFSPRDSQPFQDSLSTAQDSQSQRFTQTNATPTQAARHHNQLRRHAPLLRNDSLSETQPEPTEVVGEDDESFPSAAQPPTAPASKNAFEVLRQGGALASIPEGSPAPKRRRETNVYLDAEANLDSDEEQAGGLNAASGDEDEEGHDAELEDLVDNEVIEEELAAIQDERADELRRENEKKDEAKALANAESLAAGKKRLKRPGFDLDDDEFDDDFRHQEKREKKDRIDTATVSELRSNPKTRAFATAIQDTSSSARPGELTVFEAAQASDYERDDDEETDDSEPRDIFDTKTRSNRADLRAEAVQRQREIDIASANSEALESRLSYAVQASSSPAPAIKLNNRLLGASSKTAAPRAQNDGYEGIESQYSVGKTESTRSFINYKAGDSREDSQGSGNGITAGGKSAVTSFGKKAPPGSKSSASSTSRKSTRNNGPSTSLGRSGSKFSKIRRGGFAS